jgi:hypothetical protein
MGGLAGGKKYVVGNIFFKLAADAYNLYGGTPFIYKYILSNLKNE